MSKQQHPMQQAKLKAHVWASNGSKNSNLNTVDLLEGYRAQTRRYLSVRHLLPAVGHRSKSHLRARSETNPLVPARRRKVCVGIQRREQLLPGTFGWFGRLCNRRGEARGEGGQAGFTIGRSAI